jgi:rod shape determining protein RodA
MNLRRYVRQHLRQINPVPVILITVLAALGFAMLYSAARGNWEPWASRQMIRFGFGFVVMIAIALIPAKLLLRYAYFPYAVCVLLLLAVEAMGFIGMGAQRWLSLGFVNLQPSEVMKIAMILALARYFHMVHHENVSRLLVLLPPAIMLAVPVVLILHQPNLGTATILSGIAVLMFFVVGVAWRYFIITGVAILSALPVGWMYLYDYQKRRVMTFLNPESDPLGAGYNIMQSKIAIGSGGLFGKGFLQGSQSQLEFLPEKETDFIFTMLAEEWGFIGGFGVLILYLLLMYYGLAIAMRCKHTFGSLLATGITAMIFLHVLINVAMVMGLLPVVGVPLPLLSYGGTIIVTIMMGFGLMLNAYVHRDEKLPRASGGMF